MDVKDVAAVMNLAGLGVVTYLLLTKVDARLSALERAVNRFVIITALDLVGRNSTSEEVRREAQYLIAAVHREGASKGEPSFYESERG